MHLVSGRPLSQSRAGSGLAADSSRVIFAKPVGSGFQDSYALWLENGTLRGVVQDASGSGPILSAPFPSNLGQWHHVAYTFDDANKQQALYSMVRRWLPVSPTGRLATMLNHCCLGGTRITGTPPGSLRAPSMSLPLQSRSHCRRDCRHLQRRAAGKTLQDPTSPITCFADAIAGLDYTQTNRHSAGNLPVSITLVDGALPPGLILAPAGLLSGTPTTVGSFSFVLRASDAALVSAEQAFTLEVLPKLAPPAGLAGCWRAEGDALDALGMSDGVPVNGASFAPGQVGQAFLLDAWMM